MIDLVPIMARLAQKRPVFHSEADFQHALAWELHEALPDAQVRLEYRVPGLAKTYVDIWLTTAAGPVAIELKYVSRRFDVTVGGERFDLNDHGAQDQLRYDFIKDVVRCERVAETIPGSTGMAILLTNDASLWKESLRSGQIDAAFRLHEGRQLQGSLAWDPGAGAGTTRGRTEPHALTGLYTIAWRDYCILPDLSGRFRYLLVQVTP